MPFGNPLVAGEDLIRSGIRSENFTDGSVGVPGTGWRIARDGTATFNNLETRGNAQGPSAAYDVLSANTSLLYRGTELATLIARLPKGLIAIGTLPNAFYAANAGAYVTLLELDIPTSPNRMLEVTSNPFRLTSNTVNDRARVLLFYTEDGTQPVPFAGTTQLGELAQNEVNVGGNLHTSQVSWFPFTGASSRIRVVMVIHSEAGANITTLNELIKLHAFDRGEFYPFKDTGINRYSAGPAPLTFRTFDIGATDFRSYRGDGTYFTDQLVYQGQSPYAPNGNMDGYIWFNIALMNDIFGVAPANIAYLDVFLQYPHWYGSNGGDCVLGYHVVSVPTPQGQNQPGGFPDQRRQYYPGRNIGQWFTVLNTGIANSIQAGTFRGLLTGPAPPNNLGYYGYANVVRIRGGYYK